jgi:hypothetical protein
MSSRHGLLLGRKGPEALYDRRTAQSPKQQVVLWIAVGLRDALESEFGEEE